MESANSFKRKMLLWTNSWFQEETKFTEKVQFVPDASELARLLQALGFRVRSSSEFLSTRTSESSTECQGCQVILICPKSRRRIELDAPKLSSKSDDDHSQNVNEANKSPIVETGESGSIIKNPEIKKTVSQLIEGILRVMSIFPELNNDNNNREKLDVEGASLTATPVQHLQSTPTSDCGTSMNTPSANGIAVVTPNAPRIPKPSSSVDAKSVPPGRYRSLDTLISSGSSFSDELPEPGQLTPKDNRDSELGMDIDVDCDLNATIAEGPGSANKKFISKSSPAFHTTEKFQRSGTFTFSNDQEKLTMTENKQPATLLRSNTFISESLAIPNTKDEPRSGPPPQKTPSQLIPHSLILSKLKDVQNTVSEIISMYTGHEKSQLNIDELTKALRDVAAEQDKTTDVRPIRCLSDFGGASNLARVATKVRSIPRLTLRKRATTIADQVTPTTSRREESGSGENGRKKSSSTTALQSTSSRIGSSPSTKLQKISTTPSSTIGNSGLKPRETLTARKFLTPNRKCTDPTQVSTVVSKKGIVRK